MRCQDYSYSLSDAVIWLIWVCMANRSNPFLKSISRLSPTHNVLNVIIPIIRKDRSPLILILRAVSNVIMIKIYGIDGPDIYKRIIEISPGQKAIIVSGFVENELVRKAQQLGAGQYIKKPYTLEKIGHAIKHELSR